MQRYYCHVSAEEKKIREKMTAINADSLDFHRKDKEEDEVQY